MERREFVVAMAGAMVGSQVRIEIYTPEPYGIVGQTTWEMSYNFMRDEYTVSNDGYKSSYIVTGRELREADLPPYTIVYEDAEEEMLND